MEQKLLRSPTGRTLTSWLFAQHGRGVKLASTETTSDSGREDDLNLQIQRSKPLGHAASTSPQKHERKFD